MSILLVLWSWQLHAAPQTPGWQAYVAGDLFAARTMAREAGLSEGSADAFGLACRAGLAIGGFLEQDADAVQSLHQALDDCGKALAIDPNHYVASLSYAIALGFEGLRLRQASYARTSKRRIEGFIETYPQNALARGALAGWHAAVAREGWLARLFLGASRARAESLYKEALELPNQELPLLYEYVRFLADGDKSERERAAVLARTIVQAEANDGFEAILLEKTAAILAAINSDRKEVIDTSLSAATPFADIDDWGTPAMTSIEAYTREGSNPDG